MLRIAVIALVALNLLLLVLEASKPPPPETAVDDSPGIPWWAPDLPKIRLLGELGEDASGDGPGTKCFTVGPFETVEKSEEVHAALGERAVTVSQRQTQEQVERGFWVYMPPFDTAEEARVAARSMRDAGISDVDVLSDGEWGNSISLGYFINESNASAHRELVRDRGFDAQTRVQQDTETRYWLDYEQAIGSLLAARALAGSIPPRLHSPIPCVSLDPPEDKVPYTAR